MLGFLGNPNTDSAVEAANRTDPSTREFASDFLQGRVFNALLSTKNEIQNGYRTQQALSMQARASKNSRAASLAQEAQLGLRQSKDATNTAIEKHDELVSSVKSKSRQYLDRPVDIRPISSKVYEPYVSSGGRPQDNVADAVAAVRDAVRNRGSSGSSGGSMSGLGCSACMMAAGMNGLGDLGAAPAALVPLLGLVATYPVAFAIGAALTVLIGVIVIFGLLVLLWALADWLYRAITGSTNVKSVLEQFAAIGDSFANVLGKGASLFGTLTLGVLVVGGGYIAYKMLEKRGKI